MTTTQSYGTTGASHNAGPNRADNHNATEQDALIPKQNSLKPSLAGWKRYLNADVRRERADLILLFTYIITGLLDSTATAVWGSFVSMQTGNTVYVGLGLAHPTQSTRWIKSGTSILSFCAGSFLFARFHRAFSVRRRWVLLVSVTIQLVFILASAFIAQFTHNVDPGTNHDKHWHVLLPLALMAFQSAGQAVISRAINYNALTSVVLTSIYCDLFMDAKLFASLADNVERNRRTAAPLLLLGGAILGGLWSATPIGIAGALWTAAALKLITLVAWLFWPSDEPAAANGSA